MKVRIFSLFLILLLLTVNCKQNTNNDDNDDDDDEDITTMTFLVEYEPQEDNDIVEIGVLVQAERYSLKQALKAANQLVAKVTHSVEQFCQNYPPENQEANCDEAVDTGDFDITADYQKVRRQLEFSKFIVSYEITIKVFATQKIGELADDLIKIGVTKIQSFDWASNQEDESQQGAIEAGQQKSHDMCFHLGMKLHRIVTVEAVQQQNADQGGDDEEGEQQQEEDEAPVVYRFQIESREKAQQEQEQKAEKQKEQQEKKKRDDDDEQQQQKPKKKAKKEKSKKKAKKE